LVGIEHNTRVIALIALDHRIGRTHNLLMDRSHPTTARTDAKMATELLPQAPEPSQRVAERKSRISRRWQLAIGWGCFLGWPVLLAVPNPFLGNYDWVGILIAWLLIVSVEALLPTGREALKGRKRGDGIVIALLELLVSFNSPSR
jgi:hypothetical protein